MAPVCLPVAYSKLVIYSILPAAATVRVSYLTAD